MGILWLLLSLGTLAVLMAMTLETINGLRTVHNLQDVREDNFSPRLSIIIPARNEADTLEKALQSVVHQAYANFEVIVVDDRSTDGTGALLDRLAHQYSCLRVIHLQSLPTGWMGKNHALHYAASQATGEFLLFTDADIVMQPQTVSKALNYACQQQLDHLTVMPAVIVPGVALNMFVGTFGLFFVIFTKPWQAHKPQSTHSIGIGAFNLVRTSVYRAIGGHEAIKMRPDDDIKLAKLLKKQTKNVEILNGHQLISVKWYPTLRAMINGLMKNAFAGLDYQISTVLLSSLLLFVLFIWPVVALFLATGATWLVNGGSVLVMLLLYAYTAKASNLHPWYAIGFPLMVLIFIYVMWRSMLLTLLNNGISWRDTHYSLAELKANKV
jgi:glycosyltransferase involved in cell wall biosynthesis